MSETLRQYQWRFRDNAGSQAEVHGVYRETVQDALRTLGIADDGLFPFGVGMRIACVTEKNRMPEGSLLMSGSPDDLRSFGLFIKSGRDWVHLLGHDYYMNSGTHQVERVGTEQVMADWLAAEATDEERLEVARWKAKAWVVCEKVQRQHSWCSTFNSIMRNVELDASALREVTVGGYHIGQTVNPAQAHGLPVGTVLRWSHHRDPDDNQVWYLRDDGSANQARTIRMFGWRDDGGTLDRHYAETMEVVAFPGEDGLVRVPLPRRAMDLVPVGTVFSADNSTQRYVKARDGLIAPWRAGNTGTPQHGEYRIADFGGTARFIIDTFGSQHG